MLIALLREQVESEGAAMSHLIADADAFDVIELARMRKSSIVPDPRAAPLGDNGYALGLSIFPPTTFNLARCLPNKFFDFSRARLGLIVRPAPEIKGFVETYRIGLVLPDFEPSSFARALETLAAERIAAWKASSAAHGATGSSGSQATIWANLITGVPDSARFA